MADLVWSDPDSDKEEFAISPRSVRFILDNTNTYPRWASADVLSDLVVWVTRVDRGAGYTFGAQVVKKFLNLNRFEHMLRAHQLCMDGYSELFGQPPLLSTVWSAPNVRFRPFF